jgi:hypothetical protein
VCDRGRRDRWRRPHLHQQGGTVNANAITPLTIPTGSTVDNSGTLEATSGGDLIIDDSVKNSKIIEALGAGAMVVMDGLALQFPGS